MFVISFKFFFIPIHVHTILRIQRDESIKDASLRNERTNTFLYEHFYCSTQTELTAVLSTGSRIFYS